MKSQIIFTLCTCLFAFFLDNFLFAGVAVGNLGLLSLKQDDTTTAKACLEQHLQLTQSLKCINGECNAWLLLGDVSSATGDYKQAIHCYEQGRNVAQHNGMMGVLKRLTCSLGIVKGTSDLESHMSNLVHKVTKEINESQSS